MITYNERPELEDNEFLVFAEHVETVAHKIELANRKLARNGIEDRFQMEEVGQWLNVNDNGTVFDRRKITISHPQIGLNGFEFIGKVNIEAGGTMLRMVPGMETPEGYERPDNHNCDHCGVRRNRVKSYLVREIETGKVMQIGSTCLELFFGIQIKGLWALECFSAEELAEFAEEGRGEGRGGYVETLFSREMLIALALVITNGGKGFVSRGTANPENGRFATADQVLETISFRPMPRTPIEIIQMMNKRMADAKDMIANDIEAIEEVLKFAETLGYSDYAENARVAANSEVVSYRAVGVLVSLVGVWYRAQEKEAAAKVEKAERNQEFVGEPKARLRDLKLNVVSMKEFETQYGTTTLLIMTDEANHTLKWFASKMFDFEVGAKLTLDATVKAHETYQGNNETVLTRGRIHSVQEGADA